MSMSQSELACVDTLQSMRLGYCLDDELSPIADLFMEFSVRQPTGRSSEFTNIVYSWLNTPDGKRGLVETEKGHLFTWTDVAFSQRKYWFLHYIITAMSKEHWAEHAPLLNASVHKVMGKPKVDEHDEWVFEYVKKSIAMTGDCPELYQFLQWSSGNFMTVVSNLLNIDAPFAQTLKMAVNQGLELNKMSDAYEPLMLSSSKPRYENLFNRGSKKDINCSYIAYLYFIGQGDVLLDYVDPMDGLDQVHMIKDGRHWTLREICHFCMAQNPAGQDIISRINAKANMQVSQQVLLDIRASLA